MLKAWTAYVKCAALGPDVPLARFWYLFCLVYLYSPPILSLGGEAFLLWYCVSEPYITRFSWLYGVSHLRDSLNLRGDFEHLYLKKKYCNYKPMESFEFWLSACAPWDDLEPLGTKEWMLWFGCLMSYTGSCVWMLSPHLVVLLWKVKEPLGRRAWLRKWASRVQSCSSCGSLSPDLLPCQQSTCALLPWTPLCLHYPRTVRPWVLSPKVVSVTFVLTAMKISHQYTLWSWIFFIYEHSHTHNNYEHMSTVCLKITCVWSFMLINELAFLKKSVKDYIFIE